MPTQSLQSGTLQRSQPNERCGIMLGGLRDKLRAPPCVDGMYGYVQVHCAAFLHAAQNPGASAALLRLSVQMRMSLTLT